MKKVLIYESNEKWLKTYIKSLEKLDFKQNYHTDNKTKFFELFDAQKFKFILMNLDMEDGFEVLETLREKDKDIPVIGFSEVSGKAMMIQALKLGISSDIIVLPFSFHVLEKRLVEAGVIDNPYEKKLEDPMFR